MLLFTCDRCKFRSPGFSALCETCGAHIRKVNPVKEILYQLQSTKEESVWDDLVSFFGLNRPNIFTDWLSSIKSRLTSIQNSSKLQQDYLVRRGPNPCLLNQPQVTEIQDKQFGSALTMKPGAEGTTT